MRSAWKGALPIGITRIPQKPILADMLTAPDGIKAMADPFKLPIGYIKSQGSIACLDLQTCYSSLIIGPKKSGRTTILQAMALTLLQKGVEVHMVGPESLVEWGRKNKVSCYSYGSAAWMEQFDKIKALIASRSSMLLEARKVSLQHKQEISSSFSPVAILIDDLDLFMNAFAKEQGMLDYLKFCVRDDEKIASFKLYTFVTIQRKSLPAHRIKEPLATMLGVNRGIMLQGVTYDCDPYKITNLLPGAKRTSELPRGEAFIVSDEEAAHLVLPRVKLDDDEEGNDTHN